MKELYIIGAGGFGREVSWLVERINGISQEWVIKGFLDDKEEIWGESHDGYPVLGGCKYLKGRKEAWVVCAVGSSRIRRQIIERLNDYENIQYATLVDPDATIGKNCSIAEGSILCAGSIVTADIKIGKHTIVNLDCTIGHDTELEDFVTVYPGAHISGCCKVGECSELGTGMQIIQGKHIGTESIIGAGAVVIRDIPGRSTAVGNPAKVIKSCNAEEDT